MTHRLGGLVCALLASLQLAAQSYVISTVAGSDINNVQATGVELPSMYWVAVDATGNVYCAGTGFQRLYKISPGGQLTVLAGMGAQGFSGDGGPATGARLSSPQGLAVDSSGNIYIADTSNNRIRRVNPATGVITTVAGNGTAGFSGDGGTATSAQLKSPVSVAVSSSGDLFISDTANNRIRRVSGGVITTVAGTGVAGFSGDGGSATSAQLNTPRGIAIDSSGNLFIADYANQRVRRVSGGVIATVAGTGVAGYNGDGGAATSAQLDSPPGVAVDSSGNLFVSDYGNQRIRRVSGGIISTVAGTGTAGFSGDGGPAANAQLRYPMGLAVDASGNLFVADVSNKRIRRVDALSGNINTIAGGGANGDGGPATSAKLYHSFNIVFDASGSAVTIADYLSDRVRRIAGGNISTFAGNGIPGSTGDGGPATSARFSRPSGIARDSAGNIYIADTMNNRIRRVDAVTGNVTVVAGTGTCGYSGDGGPANTAQICSPYGSLAFDPGGNLFITDNRNHAIRRVDGITGIITTVAGTGTGGFNGDNVAATSAQLNYPNGIAFDGAGNLYIADETNYRVRRVDAVSKIITTVAGTGNPAFSGDGGPAASAGVDPFSVALDSAGNLFIADFLNYRIRRVDAATGIITTIAGTGVPGFSGDGGAATSAQLSDVFGVTVDSSGKIWVADAGNNRLRVLSPSASVTIATSPAGLAMTVDGTSYTAPQTFSWIIGSSHTVSISSPQPFPPGLQYVFAAWADGPASNPRNFTAPSSNTTYTANFTTQYQLTTIVSPSGAGSVTPSGGFYNSGTPVQLTASANPGYAFSSWSGDLSGTQNPQNIVIGPPRTVTANFACAPFISPTVASLSNSGGTVSITLSNGATCPWTSTSGVGWITPNAPTSGSGSALVTFAVAANTTTSARSGSVTVAGIPVQVTQAGVACTFNATPNFTLPLSASSQSYSFTLTASASSCGWTASANASWVHLAQTSGTGTASNINFTVDANSLTVSRAATITAGGQNLSLVQAPAQPPPCTFTLPQSAQSFAAAGGAGTAAVAAGSGCAWTAASNSAWIHITSGASGSGNGTVSYSVDSFSGSMVRSGTLTIAGLTYTVSQQPAQAYACTASAMPPALRSQGRTELLGDIVLMCAGQLPAAGVTANVSLTLNTTFSSRITDPATGSTEALLLINEPAAPVLGTNAFRGRVAGYNVVSWQNVPLTSAATILRLANVRADASLAGTGAVTATVSIQSTVPVPVANARQTVGQALPGVSFQRSPQALPGPNPSTQAVLQVSFQEGTATSFKVKVAPNQNPSTPGTVYNSESGFVNTAVLGTGTGLATSGTLLRVTVSNVPNYMQVQFPASDVNGKTQAYGTPSNTAAWEVLVADPMQLETLTFNLLVQNAASTDPNLAQIQIVGSLAPVTTATGASATAAIPRFIDPAVVSPAVNLRATSALASTSAPVAGPPRNSAAAPLDTGVTAGGNLTFAQTVLNDTDSQATNVVVRDNLPPGLVLQSCSSSDGASCSINGNDAQVTYSQMDPGETRTVTVLALVDPLATEGTVLENDFTVASDQAPLNLQNNVAGVAVVVTVNPAAPTVAILTPTDGATVSGTVQVTGWALDNANRIGRSIDNVEVLVDGNSLGNATYGQSSNACTSYPNRPGCPNVGYVYSLNTAGLTPGPHQLTVMATDTDPAPDSGSATITIQVGAPINYTIGGHVALFGGGIVTNVLVSLSGSQTDSKAPDASGNYSFTVNPGGTYTVTPTLAGYTFAPASRTFSNLTASQTANFSGSGTLQFYPIPPCRVADTRSFTGPPGPLGPPSLTAGAGRSFPVRSSACGIPSNAVAYSLNVSAVPASGYLQYVTVWPTGQPMPVASTLNSWDGRIVANGAIIPAGTGGAISIFASNPTDVFFDINGYFAPPGAGSLEFYPMTPCRIADTRSFTGPPGPLGPPSMNANGTRSFPVLSSACGIPATAVAYSLNMSAVPGTNYLGYLTAWGTGQPQPIASTLNSWTGTIVANAAIVPAGTSGAISIYVSDATDVFFDINGYFAPAGTGGLQYHPVVPCRVADTRPFTGPPAPLGPPSMTAGSSRSFPVLASACGVPAAAAAYAFNVTAVPTAGYLQYLTTWGTGQAMPVASTLNSWTGTIVPNAAFVPAGTGGAISIFVSDPSDVFFDVNGYFAP